MRHATSAYQALSQGVASSKRLTKSFDMAALPSVPEMNTSAIPSRTSQEVSLPRLFQLPVHYPEGDYKICGCHLTAPCTHLMCDGCCV